MLVVGGPTHRHGVSSVLRETLACLGDRALDGIRVATFDTRLHGSRLVTGSAAVRLARLLRHHGACVVAPAASFLVEGGEGPLDEGELEHAQRVGRARCCRRPGSGLRRTSSPRRRRCAAT